MRKPNCLDNFAAIQEEQENRARLTELRRRRATDGTPITAEERELAMELGEGPIESDPLPEQKLLF